MEIPSPLSRVEGEWGIMQEITSIWGPVRSLLRERLTAYRLTQVLGNAGFDMERITNLPLTTNTEDKNRIIQAVDAWYGDLLAPQKCGFVRAALEEVLVEKPELASDLERRLNRLGFKIEGTSVLPIEVLDPSELLEIPDESRTDLIKAAERYMNGDLSGAMSAACGAVDSATSRFYTQHNLGDPGDDSFQKKVKVTLKQCSVMQRMVPDLLELGWDPKEAELLRTNLEGAFNQGAYVMQSLRSGMGDVHGTKPVLRPLVFDSIKWATLILRLLQQNERTS